jgi:hypothetical protein
MWKRVSDVRVVSSTYQHVRVVSGSDIHIVSVCVCNLGSVIHIVSVCVCNLCGRALEWDAHSHCAHAHCDHPHVQSHAHPHAACLAALFGTASFEHHHVQTPHELERRLTPVSFVKVRALDLKKTEALPCTIRSSNCFNSLFFVRTQPLPILSDTLAQTGCQQHGQSERGLTPQQHGQSEHGRGVRKRVIFARAPARSVARAQHGPLEKFVEIWGSACTNSFVRATISQCSIPVATKCISESVAGGTGGIAYFVIDMPGYGLFMQIIPRGIPRTFLLSARDLCNGCYRDCVLGCTHAGFVHAPCSVIMCRSIARINLLGATRTKSVFRQFIQSGNVHFRSHITSQATFLKCCQCCIRTRRKTWWFVVCWWETNTGMKTLRHLWGGEGGGLANPARAPYISDLRLC